MCRDLDDLWKMRCKQKRRWIRNGFLRTLTTPETPQPTARTSPQYRSLHQLKHQPPSASRTPTPGRLGLAMACCCCAVCNMLDTLAPSNVMAPAAAGVGVPGAIVPAIDPGCVLLEDNEEILTSSMSCQDERAGCSRHS